MAEEKSRSKREINKEHKKECIRAAYIRLGRRTSPDNMTINDICKQAGIAKSTFYTYYDDKYSILDDLREELLQSLRNIIKDLTDVDISDVDHGIPLKKATEVMQYISEHLPEFQTVLGPYGDPRFEIQWKRDIEESFAPLFNNKINKRKNAKLASIIFSSSLIGLYKYFIFEQSNLSKQEYAIILGNILRYSLFDFQTFVE